jgi:hypothetical protein
VRVSPRRSLGVLLTLSVAVPVLTVMPTLTRPHASPHPVAAHLSTLALSGVDAAAAQGATPTAVARRLDAVVARSKVDVAGAARTRPAGWTRPPAILTAPMATSSFATVGVTWLPTARPVHLLVSVRTRTNGVWGRWFVVGGQSDDTSDRSELAPGARSGTSPLYVGPSDGVQVRVDRLSGPLPDDLRVDLIDPGTSPADGDLQPTAPASSAMAAGARPPIITRKQWGADESIREPTYFDSTVRAAFIHHTASSTSYSAAQAAAMVRGIYSYAVMSEGYADMPYNFLVDKFGRIYEGRKGSLTAAVHGGATGGFNTDTMSVSALGNFETSAAPSAMVDAISRLLAWRLAAFYRDPRGHTTLTDADGGTKYSVGQQVRFGVINGHRDADLTACPGGHLYAQLGTIRNQVTRYMGANLVNPGLTAPVARLTATPRTGMFEVHSRVMKKEQWRLTVTPACGTAPVRTITGTASRQQPIMVRWRGRADSGAAVAPGPYLMQLDSWAGRSRSVSWVRQVVVGTASPGLPGSGVPGSGPAGWYQPVAPRTLLDSASSAGGATPYVLAPTGRVDLPVLGRAGVPASGVSAIVLSVRTTCAARAVRLGLTPSLAARGADSLRIRAHQQGAAIAVVAPGANGEVTVTNSGSAARVIVDVVGYFATGSGTGTPTGSGYVPVRRVTVAGAGTPLSIEGRTPISLATPNSPVPVGAVAAWLQVRPAATSQAQQMWLWGEGHPRPGPPQVVTAPLTDGTHRVLVPLGANDSIDVTADAPAALSITVLGYQVNGSGARWHSVGPRRLLADHVMLAGSRAQLRIAGVRRLGVPARARYVALQIGAGMHRGPTSLSAYASDGRPARAADLVTSARTPGTALVIVPVSATGAVRIQNRWGRAAVTVDLVGWLR